VKGFADAMIRLLNDPAEREWLGQNARQRAIDKHSWEQFINQIEGIYQDVLDRHAVLNKRQEL
jgi:glycosyltransferase involved in cell wall biosynthesis